MIRLRSALLMALPGVALVLLSACGGPANAGAGNSAPAAAAPQEVTLHYTVVPADNDQAKAGPDGQKHDTFWTEDSTVVPLGAIVTVEVKNYDDGAHGMVFPDLGLAKEVAGGGKDDQPAVTTFKFTASKAGSFRWYCPVPCDTDAGAWAMSTSSGGNGQEGFMAGLITVK